MSKHLSASRNDLNLLAKYNVEQATGKIPSSNAQSEKNPAAVALGRLGGLKGGIARAKTLSDTRRSEIAKIAATARWKKNLVIGGEHMKREWSKVLTDSDAQQDTRGAKMPFLRFTKEGGPYDHTTWFHDVFFADAVWVQGMSQKGHPVEKATIQVHVVVLGNDLGVRTMELDHDPLRAQNHSAPTTHIHYDAVTRRALESMTPTGHTVVVEADGGSYRLEVR